MVERASDTAMFFFADLHHSLFCARVGSYLSRAHTAGIYTALLLGTSWPNFVFFNIPSNPAISLTENRNNVLTPGD